MLIYNLLPGAANRTGEFIEKAVLSSTADGKERSKCVFKPFSMALSCFCTVFRAKNDELYRGKAVLTKWLLSRKDVVPPDNASVVAGITTEDLRQHVVLRGGKGDKGIGKRYALQSSCVQQYDQHVCCRSRVYYVEAVAQICPRSLSLLLF